MPMSVGDLIAILQQLKPTLPIAVATRDGPITEYADGLPGEPFFDNFGGPYTIGDVEQTVHPDAPDDAVPTVMIWANIPITGDTNA